MQNLQSYPIPWNWGILMDQNELQTISKEPEPFVISSVTLFEKIYIAYGAS